MLDDVRSATREMMDREPIRRVLEIVGRLLKSPRGRLFLCGVALIILSLLEVAGHLFHRQLEMLELTLIHVASTVATWLRSTTLLDLPADFVAAGTGCAHRAGCVARLWNGNGLLFALNGGLAALDTWRSGVAKNGGVWAGIAANALLAVTAIGLWWSAKFRWDFGALGVILILTPLVAMLAGYVALGLAELTVLCAAFIVKLMLVCTALGVVFTVAGLLKDVVLAPGEFKELVGDGTQPPGATAQKE